MKNTVGQRILISILAPSLLIFGLLSAIIAYAASQFAAVSAELELRSISEINSADLTGRVYSVQISVLSAASVLETLGEGAHEGRARADNVVRSIFENPHVHNAWLAYEPDAFDGRDSEYTSDYPGAPSGRFMRSYVVKRGQILIAPDMDEETIDDPDESAWYVRPRDTGALYVDAYNDVPNAYDYGLGDDPVCTMAFAAPIYRDGKVIGCVGADMGFDVSTLYAGSNNNAAIAVFYPNGRVFFVSDPAFADGSVDTLGFAGASEIMAAFTEAASLFLPDQYSPFLNAKAFTYFEPVAVYGEDSLYMYTAIPRADILDGLMPVFMLIAGIVATVLLFILLIIIRVKRRISDPLRALMMAADAISLGDLETEIPSFPNSRDEIGVLSRSLHRMVEQFRVYILRLEQTQDEKIIYSRIDDLIASGGASGAIESILSMLCEHLGADRAIAVRLSDGSARVSARRGCDPPDNGEELMRDFSHHSRIMPMLAGKKLLLMNSYIITELGADFLDSKTRFACILPLREGSRALGYVILESGKEKNPFGAKAESILCNVAQSLSGLIKTDEKKAEIPPPAASQREENTASTGLDALRDVKGLDCAAAIQIMGGMAGLYEQALKLLTNLLPETVKKLDGLIGADISAFAVEIHGLKGSLNNVGAYDMGAGAARIEQAAKSGDISLCERLYSPFKEALAELHNELVAAFKAECGKLPGNVLALVALLPEAESAAAVDCAAALELLRPMSGFSFDAESDATLVEILSSLEAADAQKAQENIRKLKHGLTNWEEA